MAERAIQLVRVFPVDLGVENPMVIDRRIRALRRRFRLDRPKQEGRRHAQSVFVEIGHVAGILVGQEDALVTRYAAWFDDLRVAQDGDWVRIDGVRRAAA